MKIGVIGLGLIGGSVFKRLNELNYDVTGISSSVKGNNIYTDYSALTDCNLIFVCTPMNVTLSVLNKLDKILDKDVIVTDVCSLKGFVAKKEYNFNFIPSHPMAGTENNGWEASFPELFNNAKWVITPINNKKDEANNLLETVIKNIGAEIIYTTPEEHDKAVSLISHAPMIIAQALCETIKNNPLAQSMASSGFKDTTRLALSNVEMANDMVNLNKDNIKNALKLFANNSEMLIENNYKDKAAEIKKFRKTLFTRK